jgi:hypothetical protein
MKSWAIYIIAALGFVAYGAATDVDRDNTGAIVGGGSVDAFSVRVGDCFDSINSNNDEVSSVPGVPCVEPHDYEAFAVFDVSVESYPSDEKMYELSFVSCLEHFESFVGRDYESSSLEITTLYPSSESWAQDDREIVCAVFDMNANQLVGSASGRGL